MDDISKLAANLIEIVTRNTYEHINNKISMAKERKKEEERQAAYEQIINALLQDKMELERIALEYKGSYERVIISDEDIEHLQNTAQGLVQQFGFTLDEEQKKLVFQLISRDTIKTAQLLGFNFKEAIGQPLTDVCANAIKKNIGGKKK